MEVAQGMPAWQSSLRSDKGHPWKAVDDNSGGHYDKDGCTETDEEESPYWSVDLGQNRMVHYVTIQNRADCCGMYI